MSRTALSLTVVLTLGCASALARSPRAPGNYTPPPLYVRSGDGERQMLWRTGDAFPTQDDVVNTIVRAIAAADAFFFECSRSVREDPMTVYVTQSEVLNHSADDGIWVSNRTLSRTALWREYIRSVWTWWDSFSSTVWVIGDAFGDIFALTLDTIENPSATRHRIAGQCSGPGLSKRWVMAYECSDPVRCYAPNRSAGDAGVRDAWAPGCLKMRSSELPGIGEDLPYPATAAQMIVPPFENRSLYTLFNSLPITHTFAILADGDEESGVRGIGVDAAYALFWEAARYTWLFWGSSQDSFFGFSGVLRKKCATLMGQHLPDHEGKMTVLINSSNFTPRTLYVRSGDGERQMLWQTGDAFPTQDDAVNTIVRAIAAADAFYHDCSEDIRGDPLTVYVTQSEELNASADDDIWVSDRALSSTALWREYIRDIFALTLDTIENPSATRHRIAGQCSGPGLSKRWVMAYECSDPVRCYAPNRSAGDAGVRDAWAPGCLKMRSSELPGIGEDLPYPATAAQMIVPPFENRSLYTLFNSLPITHTFAILADGDEESGVIGIGVDAAYALFWRVARFISVFWESSPESFFGFSGLLREKCATLIGKHLPDHEGKMTPAPAQEPAGRAPRAAEASDTDAQGNTPVHLAAASRAAGATEVVRALLDSAGAGGRPLETVEAARLHNGDGNTPLHLAATAGNLQLCSLLLNYGADPDTPNAEGKTPLHCASAQGHLQLVQLFVEHEGHVEARDRKNRTSLHFAAAAPNPDPDVLNYLAMDSEGKQPIDYAATMDHPMKCSALKRERGAGVEELYQSRPRGQRDAAAAAAGDEETTYDRWGFEDTSNHAASRAELEDSARRLRKERERSKKWAAMLQSNGTAWERGGRRDASRLRRRVYKGIPAGVRGVAWQLLCHAQKRRLQYAPDHYARLLEGSTQWAEQIDLDIHRSFRNHYLFHEAYGPGQVALFHVLKAYSLFDAEVGYCQGMSDVAAFLLMYMSEEEAFWVFVQLLNEHEYSMRGLFLPGFPLLHQAFHCHTQLLRRELPRLAEHFERQNIRSVFYATRWFMTGFIGVLPIELATRLWDVFLLEGYRVMFTTAVRILRHYQKTLMAMSFDQLMLWLPTLNAVSMDADEFAQALLKESIPAETIERLKYEHTREVFKENAESRRAQPKGKEPR
eukprot:m51a1_g8827 hypothetical protein (1165) ;mRNA; f:372055-385135